MEPNYPSIDKWRKKIWYTQTLYINNMYLLFGGKKEGYSAI